jgi:hypothetical protein
MGKKMYEKISPLEQCARVIGNGIAQASRLLESEVIEPGSSEEDQLHNCIYSWTEYLDVIHASLMDCVDIHDDEED